MSPERNSLTTRITNKLKNYIGVGLCIGTMNCAGAKKTIDIRHTPVAAQKENKNETPSPLDREYEYYHDRFHSADSAIANLTRKDALAIVACLSLNEEKMQAMAMDEWKLKNDPATKKCNDLPEKDKEDCYEETLRATKKEATVKFYKKYDPYQTRINHCLVEMDHVTNGIEHKDNPQVVDVERRTDEALHSIQKHFPGPPSEYLDNQFCKNPKGESWSFSEEMIYQHSTGRNPHFRNPYFSTHRQKALLVLQSFRKTHEKEISACISTDKKNHHTFLPPHSDTFDFEESKNPCVMDLFRKDPSYQQYKTELNAGNNSWASCILEVGEHIKK